MRGIWVRIQIHGEVSAVCFHPRNVQLTSCRSKKVSFYFFKTIVFNALIPNILLSRLSDEQKCIFSHLKSVDFETFCDWSTSSWRNNLDTPWCNNLVCNNLDDVITLWCDVKIVTPQGHVLFTAFGKLMFEYIFWYEGNQWFLNDIAQKFWKIMGFQNMINSHDMQLVNCCDLLSIYLNRHPHPHPLSAAPWKPCFILNSLRH